jgi:uncharacterized protein DUF4180
VKLRVRGEGASRFLESLEPIAKVDDALELISAGFEHRARRLLLDCAHLPPDFFELRTRFASEFLQKLENYHFKVAGVFPPGREYGERFAQFLLEARRGAGFRAFDDRESAEEWLVE